MIRSTQTDAERPARRVTRALATAGILAATAAVAVPAVDAYANPSDLAPSATSAARTAPSACTPGDVTVSYRVTDAGAGQRYGRLVVTNTSGSACSIRGYGGLSYVGGGDGTQIGASASRTAGTVRTVVLQRGGKAVSEVHEAVSSNYPTGTCRPRKVDGFRVYLPGATASEFVAHRTTGCASTKVHLLSHTPFRAAA
ncbi:DUF4232 domain-containing protein [Nocardioides sp. TRM66260-LWL]|uniref:DUF4232 domain-containing protein n=1 Tax=Nocardioides sp. TRM66260-LWL TaxID=2874478 RepID=UPI001CC4C029|nr:DUF4232 domain-containing protein [Nocardioides sp. TRM66260-LWL]MBZ5735224.1 DUF4232 domain-containing protein [Nocardioides sp. TRM66260-LWL]